MSSRIATFRSITGEGRPRLILEKPNDVWASFGATTYTATTVTEAEGATTAVTSSNAPNEVVVGIGHGLLAGQFVAIKSHTGSTPDINGTHKLLSVAATKLYMNFTISVGGTGGTVQRTPDYSNIIAGMRVVSYISRTPYPDLPVYGRINAVDRTNKILTVDSWVGGTPANGTPYSVNGWVVEMPLWQRIRQEFGRTNSSMTCSASGRPTSSTATSTGSCCPTRRTSRQTFSTT